MITLKNWFKRITYLSKCLVVFVVTINFSFAQEFPLKFISPHLDDTVEYSISFNRNASNGLDSFDIIDTSFNGETNIKGYNFLISQDLGFNSCVQLKKEYKPFPNSFSQIITFELKLKVDSSGDHPSIPTITDYFGVLQWDSLSIAELDTLDNFYLKYITVGCLDCDLTDVDNSLEQLYGYIPSFSPPDYISPKSDYYIYETVFFNRNCHPSFNLFLEFKYVPIVTNLSNSEPIESRVFAHFKGLTIQKVDNIPEIIHVYQLNGKLIASTRISDAGLHLVRFNSTDQIVIIKIQKDNQVFTHKIFDNSY